MIAPALEVIAGTSTWAVIQGDCQQLLALVPPEKIDHVVTDPPYSEHVHGKQRRMLRGGGGREADRNGGRSARGEIHDAPLGFDALKQEVRKVVAAHLGRITRGWCLVFSDQESQHLWRSDLVANGLKHVRCGAWVKLAGQPQLSGDRPAVGHEAIEIAHGPTRLSWNGGGGPAVWHVHIETDRNKSGSRVHTTQKPLKLMLELIEQFTRPGDLVLDPFAGSGTTGVACMRLGRRFIGFEQDETYANIARERIAAESRNLSLPAARAGQSSIFDAMERAEPDEPKPTPQPMRLSALSTEKRDRIKKLHQEGLTGAVISERLGLHLNTVHAWLLRLGLKRNAWCTCGRKLRGKEQRCYVCRGMRISKTRDLGPKRSRQEASP